MQNISRCFWQYLLVNNDMILYRVSRCDALSSESCGRLARVSKRPGIINMIVTIGDDELQLNTSTSSYDHCQKTAIEHIV